MTFIYMHTSCHEIQVSHKPVPCTLAPDITALILRYIHAYLYAKVMFSLWNFNSIAFSANALTRSKRIHEVRNQGASPLVLLALFQLALPLLFTLQKFVVLSPFGDVEHNQYIIHPFLLIFYFVFRSLFLIFSYQPLPN